MGDLPISEPVLKICYDDSGKPPLPTAGKDGLNDVNIID